MDTICQLSFITSPRTKGRTLLVGLSDGETYRIQAALGVLSYAYPTGDAVVASPALLAVGNTYRYWLAGGGDPLALLAAKPQLIDGLYPERIQAVDEPDPTGLHSLRQFMGQHKDPVSLEKFVNAAGSSVPNILGFIWGREPADCGLNESDMSDLRAQAKQMGWDRGPVVGMGCTRSSGSDSYPYTVVNVSLSGHRIGVVSDDVSHNRLTWPEQDWEITPGVPSENKPLEYYTRRKNGYYYLEGQAMGSGALHLGNRRFYRDPCF
jgi:hypothetical protein